MTKKDYELIAQWAKKYSYTAVIRHSSDGAMTTEIRWYQGALDGLADTLATNNPKFDRTRFLQACGVTK